jgi:hypothetical protein
MTVRIAVLFLASATLGTCLDQIHVRAEATAYTAPTLFGQAWWVPLLFGVAGILLGVVPARLTRETLAPRLDRVGAAALAAEGVWFTAAYLVTGLLHTVSWGLLFLLVCAYAGRVVGSRAPLREGVVVTAIGAAAAVGGVLVETTLVSLGLFRHSGTELGLVPAWLPGLYLHASLLGRAIGRFGFDGR